MTEPSGPPDTELSALREQLVQLITQQRTIFTNWVKFAITVQGGLAAGLGFVLGTSALAKYRLLGVIISLVGIAAAVVFASILVRHTRWTDWWVRRGDELDRSPRRIFPRQGDIEEVKWKELALPWRLRGHIIRCVVAFLWVVVIVWVVIFVWLIRLDTEALPPNPSFKTWNNCPLNYTVQGGMCKPYRGP